MQSCGEQDTFLNTLHQIAHKELHQQPVFMKEAFFNVIVGYALDIDVRKQQQTLKVTTKRVLGIMQAEDKDHQTSRFLMNISGN